MSLSTVVLLAMLCPQGDSKGQIVLPPAPPPATAPAAEETLQLSPLEEFRRDAFQLRRSAMLPSNARDLVLQKIGEHYPEAGKLALALARQADGDELCGLLEVLRRYGHESAADELLFLLLTRPFGSATRDGVEVTASLAGERGKEMLLRCITAKYSAVRKAATDLLLARVEVADVPRLLQLSNDDNEDVARKALFLLGALPTEESRQRLIEALSNASPTVAATACESLIEHGLEAAPALVEKLSHPATDRSFGYAAYALSALEDRTGRVLLDDSMVPALKKELTGPDPFMRATTALAMANLAFRSDDTRGTRYDDREIVDGLLLIVAPRDYVSNLSMLNEPATVKLVQFTGQDRRGDSDAWRSWWDATRPGFVGTRLKVAVTPDNGDGAVVVWKDSRRAVRFRGVDAEIEDDWAPPDVLREDYVLTGAEMASLVDRLQTQGFMTQGILASASGAEMLPVARSLELRLGEARSRVAGPAPPARWLDALQTEVDEVGARERWQLYTDAETAQDRITAWQQEREWLAAHPDRKDRQRRLIDRILAAFPALQDAERQRAIGHLLEVPDLRELLTEADGLRLAELVAASPRLDDDTFQLLELAVLAPGDVVWRKLLDAVDAQYDHGGKEAMARVFALLGPDRVRAAISDGRGRIRVAAILEIANLKDTSAVPSLLAALQDEDAAVVEAAVYSLGMVGATQAHDQLLALESAETTSPSIRRATWVALGRIGGSDVLPVLQAAVAAPELADQLAGIRALGELQDPRAAQLLAQIFVAHGFSPRGTQAMASLQQMGPLLAAPALRRHLGARDEAVRQEIVMLLAEMQDPAVVPDLIELLGNERTKGRAAVLLAGITGVDLAGMNDRVAAMRQWWRTHKDVPQGNWFLESCQQNGLSTTLTSEQLAPHAGHVAVEELTRLMEQAPQPHLRVLAAALLRNTTDKDFGSVSVQSSPTQIRAVADRYRFFAAAERAAGDR